jgi:hypothetical protein
MHLIPLKANTASKLIALHIFSWIYMPTKLNEKEKFGRRFAFPLLYPFLKERI